MRLAPGGPAREARERTVIGYLIRRVLWGVTLLVVISFATFALFFVVPQDRQELGRGFSAVEINLREAASLNSTPLPAQWAQYMWNAVRHQSLGQSFRSQEDVADIIMRALPVTVSLILGGVVLFLLVAIPIGILSAVRSRSALDRLSMIVVLIGVSAHPIWIGLMLSYLFGYRWGLAPITGYCDLVNPSTGTSCGGFVDWSYHLLLPWITFAILFAALVRAHDPGERARVARRGLRPHRPGEGWVEPARAAPPRAAERRDSRS